MDSAVASTVLSVMHCFCVLLCHKCYIIIMEAAQLICLGCILARMYNQQYRSACYRSVKLHYIIMCYLCMLQLLIGKKRLSVKGIDYSVCTMHVTIYSYC